MDILAKAGEWADSTLSEIMQGFPPTGVEGMLRKCLMLGYAQGSTEQRQKDIDNACEWLKAHYKDIYWEVESPTRKGNIGEYLANDFRKAMEE